MTETNQAAIRQVDGLLHAYERYSDLQDDAFENLPASKASEAIARISDGIERLTSPASMHRRNAQAAIQNWGVANAYTIGVLVGILKGLRQDLSAGYLETFRELVHAEMFADFLEMAEYLAAEGYKDAAAVILGGALEEHLRNLCLKHAIPRVAAGRPIKAETMNAELARANVYSKLDQKNVTAWLDLRNRAAHGNYDGYSEDQVRLMLQGERDFMARNPA